MALGQLECPRATLLLFDENLIETRESRVPRLLDQLHERLSEVRRTVILKPRLMMRSDSITVALSLTPLLIRFGPQVLVPLHVMRVDACTQHRLHFALMSAVPALMA